MFWKTSVIKTSEAKTVSILVLRTFQQCKWYFSWNRTLLEREVNSLGGSRFTLCHRRIRLTLYRLYWARAVNVGPTNIRITLSTRSLSKLQTIHFQGKGTSPLWISLPSSSKQFLLLRRAGHICRWGCSIACWMHDGCWVLVIVLVMIVFAMMRQLASLRERGAESRRWERQVGWEGRKIRFRMSERKVEQEMQPHDRRGKAA